LRRGLFAHPVFGGFNRCLLAGKRRYHAAHCRVAAHVKARNAGADGLFNADRAGAVAVHAFKVNQLPGNYHACAEEFADGLCALVAYVTGHLQIKFLVCVFKVLPVRNLYLAVKERAGEFFHDVVGKAVVCGLKRHDCHTASRGQVGGYLVRRLFYRVHKGKPSSALGTGASRKQQNEPRQCEGKGGAQYLIPKFGSVACARVRYIWEIFG